MIPRLNGRLDPYILPDQPNVLVVPRSGCTDCDALALLRLARKGYVSRLETDVEQDARESR